MSAAPFYWSLGEGIPEALGAADAPLPADDAGLTAGAVLGGYEVLEVLGRGASGVVYRALDPGVGREVAIKLLRPGADPALAARLVREGQIAARLDHPGIGRVFSSGTWDEQPFLVYELLAGCQTLEHAFDALPPRRRVEIVLALAEALGHAHARGVVHRDVKPANVLLDSGGQPRLIDFGCARDLERSTRLTRDGALLGTPLYMAPETFEQPAGTPAGDVWSLGLILYRALSGRLPCDAESLQALAAQIWALDPADLRGFRGELPAACEDVVRRALQPEPGRRYPDAAAFAADLRRALTGAALTRRPRALAALAATLVAGAIGLTVALAEGPRSAARDAATHPPAQPGDAVDAAVTRGAWEEARALLADVDAEAPAPLRERAAALTELDRAVPRPERLRDLPPSWLAPAADALLQRAAQDLALLRTLAPPAWVRHHGEADPTQPVIDAQVWFAELGLQPDSRRARIEALLDRVSQLLGRIDAPSAGAPQRDALLRLRSAANVEAGWKPGASQGRARAGVILRQLSAHRGGPESYYDGRAAEDWLAEALTLDPECWPAHYLLGRQTYQAGDAEGLRRCVDATEYCPLLIRHLLHDLRIWSGLNPGALERLRAALTPEQAPLARLVVGAVRVEVERAAELLPEVAAEADAALARAPGSLLTRCLRAFLALRQGRLRTCERDLEVVREALHEAPTAEFFRALLLMHQGAQADDALAALLAARAKGFRALEPLDWSQLHAADYPECEPYLDDPRIRAFFTR